MKKIKFDLPIDGQNVSSIKELQEHFTTEIIGHFRTGLLERWLEGGRDSTFLPEIRKLRGNDQARSDDAVAFRELCRIFEFEADEVVIEAAVAKPTGIPGTSLFTQKEFLDWFVATTHYLSRLVSPRSGVWDVRRAHLGFGLPDAPASTDPDGWPDYVVEFISHCQVVAEVLKSCPAGGFAETLAAHVYDHVDSVLDSVDGMTREEFDGTAAEVHVEDMRPPIRMEPVRHDVRTPGRTRVSELRWTSDGVIEQAGDVDRWCFTVLSPGEVTVQTNGNLDTVGVLEDCFGIELAATDDSGRDSNFKIVRPFGTFVVDAKGQVSKVPGSNFKIVRTLDPGTYYIRVSAFRGATGRYTLDVHHNTRPARTDSRDDSELSTASFAVNHSISRARALTERLWAGVSRSLSKAHLRELRGIVGGPDMGEAEWRRTCLMIWKVLKGGARTAGSDELEAEVIAMVEATLNAEQQAALEAFGDAIREHETRMVRRFGDMGLPASGADTGMHDDA